MTLVPSCPSTFHDPPSRYLPLSLVLAAFPVCQTVRLEGSNDTSPPSSLRPNALATTLRTASPRSLPRPLSPCVSLPSLAAPWTLYPPLSTVPPFALQLNSLRSVARCQYRSEVSPRPPLARPFSSREERIDLDRAWLPPSFFPPPSRARAGKLCSLWDRRGEQTLLLLPLAQ